MRYSDTLGRLVRPPWSQARRAMLSYRRDGLQYRLRLLLVCSNGSDNPCRAGVFQWQCWNLENCGRGISSVERTATTCVLSHAGLVDDWEHLGSHTGRGDGGASQKTPWVVSRGLHLGEISICTTKCIHRWLFCELAGDWDFVPQSKFKQRDIFGAVRIEEFD